MQPLRRIGTATALSLGLLIAGAADVPATPAAPARTVPVRPVDLDRGSIDGDGAAVTDDHGAPPGLGRAALALTLDGAGEAGSDSMFGDVADEASINVTPRTVLPVRRLDRLSYWTYLPSRATAHEGVVPVLQVHLVPDRGQGRVTPDGHKILEFTPSDNTGLQGPIRSGTWQRWNGIRRGRARWRVLETGLRPMADTDRDTPTTTTTEERHQCDRHDCTITWRDVRNDFNGLVIAEVRLVLTRDDADPPDSAGTDAGATPSSGRGDEQATAVADGLSINRLTYDFSASPRRPKTMLAGRDVLAGAVAGSTWAPTSGVSSSASRN